MKVNKYRTIMISDITNDMVGKTIVVSGWVQNIRDHGGVLFLDLRDTSGVLQTVSNDDSMFKGLAKESVIRLEGTLRKRSEDTINEKLKSGEVELLVSKLDMLGESLHELPFEIRESKSVSEDIRLKYRYLDMRNEKVKDNILLRSEILHYLRNKMYDLSFTEVQTPILTASSPEGARDFIVPSRKFKGKFYALPQAPQIFKQLLMCSGFDRYFQIAPCFRDEDPRSDRLYGEFYQLDLEMSFATDEDVYEVGEKIFYDIFTHFGNKKVSNIPFRRIPYREAMLTYGTDKPDLRNPLIIKDLTEALSKSSFEPFKTSQIRGITIEKIDKSNSWYKKMEEYMKSVGAPALAYIKVGEDLSFKSSIDKFLDDNIRKELIEVANLKPNSALFILADTKNKINKLAGLLRTKLGEELELIDKEKFEFCIINDFPMYEYNEEENTWDFGHNPFSMPQGGLEALTEENIDKVLAYQFDFVCNGYEMASGAVRNHDIRIMKKAFELAGYTEEDVENKFKSLYTAFQYGAPPHAGMAPGIDRILMLLKDEENIREMVAFPLGANGADAMMGCPNEIFEKQLRETHIKIRD